MGFDEWRLHCEAWSVYYRMTKPNRREYLALVEERRGMDSRRELEREIMTLHSAELLKKEAATA